MTNKAVLKKHVKNIVPTDDAVLIIGVANAGLVGTICATYINEKLDTHEIAHISSPLFPPISVFLNGILKFPCRIYADAHEGPASVFIATTELPVGEKEVYHDVAHVLVDFAKESGIKSIVVVSGFPVQNVGEYNVYFAAEPEILDRLKKIEGIEPLPKGMLHGMEALILNETLEKDLDGFTLISPAHANMPDVMAAAAIIEVLNKIFEHLNIDVTDLKARDALIKAQLREIALQIEKQNQNERQGAPPSKSVDSLFT
ncbi:MAG: proteasome assembly chaperone family protein [Candidatus Hodarchaeota archaeon]